MKLFTLLSLLIFPTTTTLACRCMQPTAAGALDSTASIFTGTVLSQWQPVDKDQSQEIATSVRINRIIKGCSLKVSERIIVTTSSSSAGCGVSYSVGETYYFTGEIEKLELKPLFEKYGLAFKKPINSTMHASSCSFNVLRNEVSKEDRSMLSDYGKNKNQCFRKCATGTDCPNQDYYCDSGKCQLFNAKCPNNNPPTPCFADPCTVTKPCNDQSVQCTSNYCGGCYAIFTDVNRTRICNK